VSGTPGADPKHRSLATGTNGRSVERRQWLRGFEVELSWRLPGLALGFGEQGGVA